jgi:hypothetical protein
MVTPNKQIPNVLQWGTGVVTEKPGKSWVPIFT